MADDFEYEVITEPNVAGFFTGPTNSVGDFLSEEIARDAKIARQKEIGEIEKLRRGLVNRRRGKNIAKANYDRGIAILDAQQDALERADQPAKMRLPAPLDPYNSAMMNTLPGEKSKPLPASVKVPLAKAPRIEISPIEKVKLRSPKPTARSGWGNRPAPRRDARRAGARFYFSHRPCWRGHTSRRLVSGGQCLACQGIWRQANRERVREINRAYQRRTYRPKKRATRYGPVMKLDKSAGYRVQIKRTYLLAVCITWKG